MPDAFFCCIDLSVGDRTVTEESVIINTLEHIGDDSFDSSELPEMEIIHLTSPSMVDLCTPDKELQEEEEMMMLDSPVHLSPK